jgi:hypothetical protein
MGEASLLELVITTAHERHLSQNTLIAYPANRRTWLKLIAWSAAKGIALETISSERAGQFYMRRLAAGAPLTTFKLNRPSRCSMTCRALQIRWPTAASKFARKNIELHYQTGFAPGLREPPLISATPPASD